MASKKHRKKLKQQHLKIQDRNLFKDRWLKMMTSLDLHNIKRPMLEFESKTDWITLQTQRSTPGPTFNPVRNLNGREGVIVRDDFSIIIPCPV